MTHFADRLWQAVNRCRTPAMVGLDPRPDHFPEPFRSRAARGVDQAVAATIDYHRALLEVLAPKIPVVKPQAAFFEALGPAGFAALADAVEQAHSLGMLVVMDAKRGDIGSTSTAYAETFLSPDHPFPASDALTVNPYLGEDAMSPFLEVADGAGAGLFVLVRTSNPGAVLFQDHGSPSLAERVADAVNRWGASRLGTGGWSSVGAVVGATRPEELAAFRARMPHTPLLLPGFGFQGGTADGLGAAFDDQGHGAVVNSSRGILWAHEREDLQQLPDWQACVDRAVDEMIMALASVR